MNVENALQALREFEGESLTSSLSEIERNILGLGVEGIDGFCAARGIDGALINSALLVKRVVGQINVIMHAAGILCSLSELLEPGEKVESVSLGAGNTGRQFDLETNMRIAEYKFIDWRGGADTVRQNGIFKDFYELAEHETHKRKYLYVVGTEYPLKFLTGGRALSSVLSRRPNIMSQIRAKYGKGITRVRDYYEIKKDEVLICDVSPYIGRAG
ncbi:hypothetical protein IDSA_11455 [Pseudidiomarina salinarum]|uniref:Uncharacterized protein n=1 Tax=Pseudidiomarina salinarum TaxID=435908 RepID=A0A094JC68_9GAMM|nr:hypothetical protein [Pseudidiomarina salinarum]KFZ30171.1 hypothetical protein IDSA_11455 [Pseudidiomarina salinarum]RUO68672.1 hypothetical protein CWI79_11435 [Pseudidiomarina salinarum]